MLVHLESSSRGEHPAQHFVGVSNRGYEGGDCVRKVYALEQWRPRAGTEAIIPCRPK